jgi:hypothetical protein
MVLDISLFSSGRFAPANRAIPALLGGPLARQTLQFDEDRGGPLTATGGFGWRRHPCGAENAKFVAVKSNVYDETIRDYGMRLSGREGRRNLMLAGSLSETRR